MNVIKSKLDIIAGAGTCLAGFGLALIGYLSGKSSTLEIGLAALAAGVIYLLFRTRITNFSNQPLSASRPRELIFHIIFFCTFAASIYAIHSAMYRPLIYFILTSFSVAAVAANILSCNTRSQTWVLLLEILLVAFSLRYGLLYELPGFYGNDPWGHAVFIKAWLNQGHILAVYNPYDPSDYAGYANFPFLHLIVMAMQLVVAPDPKDSLFLSIGLIYIVGALFVFLLGQYLVNTKVGLLSALLVSISQFHIIWGAYLIPTTLGLVLFSMLVWLVLKNKLNIPYVLIIIIMSFSIILTHTVSSFIVAVVLVLFLAATRVFKWQYTTGVEKVYIGPVFVLLFTISMLARWFFGNYYSTRTFFEAMGTKFVYSLNMDIQFMGASFQESVTPLGPLNRIGFLLLISFTVIGILFWLSPKVINNKKAAIIAGTLGLSIATFALPLFNIDNMLPGRWLAFIAITGSAIAAEGIFALSRLVKGGVAKSLIMVFIVFIFTAFVINSHNINTRTPFYGEEYMRDPIRYAFTDGEMRAVETITKVYDGQIATDPKYNVQPLWASLGLKESDRGRVLSIDGENPGLVLIREYMYKHQLIVGCSEDQYNNFLGTFKSTNYNMIYNSQPVKAYFKR